MMDGPSPRIAKETKTIQSDPVPGIFFQPDPNNYKHFFIQVDGNHHLTQDLQAPATKEVNSKQNCFYLMTTPCLLQRLFLIQKFTTPTSVFYILRRQFGQDLSRHFKEELVSSPTDEISAFIDSKFNGLTQPRRPSE